MSPVSLTYAHVESDEPEMVVVEVAADLGVALLASAAGTGGSTCRRRAASTRGRGSAAARGPGIRWTKPSRSWFESRKPMPRPMPVSNRLADRDRLNVAMHWYWFHVLSIRSACGSGHSTWNRESRSSQSAPRRENASSTAPGSRVPRQQSRPVLVHDAGRSNFGRRPGRRRRGRTRRSPRRPARGAGRSGARRSGSSRARRCRVRASGERHRRLVQAVVDADERVARRVEAGRSRACSRTPCSGRGARGTRSCGRSRAALDLDLADRVRALEVRHVVQRLVEAELDVREERSASFALGAGVADRRLPDLRVLAGRDEEAELDLDAVLRADDARVARARAGTRSGRAASSSASSRGSRRCRRR